MKVLNSIFLIAVSLALLWHFSNIWRYGQHIIQEPSLPILLAETVGIIMILVFGIFNFVNALRRAK